MTDLQRRALARPPLTEAEVERLYTDRSFSVDFLQRVICILAESHERLRADLAKAEEMLREALTPDREDDDDDE